MLFAALLHASWNAIVKLGGDKLLTTILVTGWATLRTSQPYKIKAAASC